MPTEKPDSATHHTVENGPEEPSKDHATSACDPIPSAPPISLKGLDCPRKRLTSLTPFRIGACRVFA